MDKSNQVKIHMASQDIGLELVTYSIFYWPNQVKDHSKIKGREMDPVSLIKRIKNSHGKDVDRRLKIRLLMKSTCHTEAINPLIN